MILGPDGVATQVKTPGGADIWMVTKKYGTPDQAVLQDHEYFQIRYWYAAPRTEYKSGWYNNQRSDCHVGKEIRLTANSINLTANSIK